MKPGDKPLTNYVILGSILLLIIGHYAYANRIMWGFALSLFLLGALVATGVGRFLVRPVMVSEQEMDESDDETGQLAVSSNETTESLRHTSDTLRAQVAERTVELADANAILKREITERKRTEEALRQAEQAAQAADRAKSALLANMGHELRTPLNAIMGFSELMGYDSNLTVEQRDNLVTIERSGEQLMTLVDDVLELAEIEAGRATLQENDFDLHYALLGLEELFSPRAQAKGVVLTFERAPDVPQYVRMDKNKLRQVLMNLLGNAIKFTEKGNITLQVSQVSESSQRMPIGGGGNSHFGYLPTCHLEFRVKDTGMGIASQDLSSVFDMFVQTASGKLSCRGAGLGMPISRRFVRMMDGDLVVNSEFEKGTVFKFDVPVGITDAGQVRAHHLERRVLGLEAGQSVYRLLVVDDIEKNREWMSELLQSFTDPTGNQGFEVRQAANGQRAIEIWEEWDPHLIWMDMRMPVLDGRQATMHIKAACERNPEHSSPIIIALAACGLEEERELIRVTGCDNLVRKPLDEIQVLDMLIKHLDVHFAYAGDTAEKEAEPLQDALMAVTPRWLIDLRQATIAGDLDGMTTLIEQIRGQHTALADTLTKLAHDFEHGVILQLIRPMAQD
ncbi:MAG: response regulator [Chloroflexi bacterium]|nr:response regulator [Chloroflexota bacterium]